MPHATAEAKREYQRKWMAERRNAFIRSRGDACELCGDTERLEVDHIDPSTKTYDPREIWSRRAEVREAELAKCQVLCYDCHKAKTFVQFWQGHGTHWNYRRGCRCDACKSAHAKLASEYRAAGKKW